VALASVAVVTVVVAPPASAGETTCDVLKRGEVQRAIGHKVKSADPPSGVGGACSFTVKGAPGDMVNVWVLEGDEAETGFDVGKQLGGDDAVDVPKLGDDAVYLGEPLNTAYVLDDGTLVYLQYYVFSGDDSPKQIKRAVVTLTERALERATS
jgi:hypothetical protein